MNKINYNVYFKTIFYLLVLSILSFTGYSLSLVYGYGGSITVYQTLPTIVSSINYPLSLYPEQAGNIERSFSNGTSVNILVPKGSVDSRAVFDVELSIIDSSIIPFESTGVQMIDNFSYKIEAKNLNNEQIKSFKNEIIISITTPILINNVNNIGLYYLDEISGEWVYVPSTDFDISSGKIIFNTTHLTEFAVFVYDNTLDYTRVKTSSSTDSGVSSGIESLSLAEAVEINSSDSQVDLSSVEDAIYQKVFNNITSSQASRQKVAYFIKYGTNSSDILGAGERGGVVSSFTEAYGKLPETEEDWRDVIKIANGRWPSRYNLSREENMKNNQFFMIYKRNPDMSNQNDNAAVTIMTYGLRPANRNLNSEAAAIISFRSIYNQNPLTGSDWDIVRAIAYSGATR